MTQFEMLKQNAEAISDDLKKFFSVDGMRKWVADQFNMPPEDVPDYVCHEWIEYHKAMLQILSA